MRVCAFFNVLQQVQDALGSAMVALMPVMPVANNGRIKTGESAEVAAGRPPQRSNSLSLIYTDAPKEEVERDRLQRHGKANTAESPSGEDRLDFISIANASMAALAWRRKASHAEDLEVCPAKLSSFL